jgi:hypothetical protein
MNEENMEYTSKNELEAGIDNINRTALAFENRSNDQKNYNTDYGMLLESMAYELRKVSAELNNFGGW